MSVKLTLLSVRGSWCKIFFIILSHENNWNHALVLIWKLVKSFHIEKLAKNLTSQRFESEKKEIKGNILNTTNQWNILSTIGIYNSYLEKFFKNLTFRNAGMHIKLLLMCKIFSFGLKTGFVKLCNTLKMFWTPYSEITQKPVNWFTF